MENKKKLLNEAELDQVTGGVMNNMNNDVVLMTSWCPYCKTMFLTGDECMAHIKVCPENPANKKMG